MIGRDNYLLKGLVLPKDHTVFKASSKAAVILFKTKKITTIFKLIINYFFQKGSVFTREIGDINKFDHCLLICIF